LEKAGLDIIKVSGPNPLRNRDKPYFYEDAKKIAEVLNIPVTCIGGIKTKEQIEFILKDSKIQYVAIRTFFIFIYFGHFIILIN